MATIDIPVREGMTEEDCLLAAIGQYFRVNPDGALAIRRAYPVVLGRFTPGQQVARFIFQVSPEKYEHIRAVGTNRPEDLPEEVRKFIFGDRGEVIAAQTPREAQALQEIMLLTLQLTPEQREEYKRQASGSTDDVVFFAIALRRFIERLEEEAEASSVRQAQQDHLTGRRPILDAIRNVADLATRLRDLRGRPMARNQLAAQGSRLREELEEARATVSRLLREWGYESVEDFKRDCDRYVEAFQDQAVLMAEASLRRTDAIADDAEAAYAAGDLSALLSALQPARRRFQEASGLGSPSMEISGNPGEPSINVSQPDEAKYGEAVRMVRGLAQQHPLLGTGPDDWAKDIAVAAVNEETLRRALLGKGSELRDSVDTMQQQLDQDPETIWSLGPLCNTVSAAAQVPPDSLASALIARERREHRWDDLPRDLMLAVLALLAGLATGGGGTIAVVAAATAIGIGAYSTMLEFERYEVENAASDTQLGSNDPTIAWALVSLAGMGLDVAGLAAVFRSRSSAARAASAVARGSGTPEEALEALQAALRNQDGIEDLAEAQAEALRNLGPLSDAQAEAFLLAARARMAEQAAFAELRPAINGGERLALEAGREGLIAGEIGSSVYASLRRGHVGFDRWVRSPEAVSLVGPLDRMAPAEIQALQRAYQTAQDQAAALHAEAQLHGWSEEALAGLLDDMAREPSTPLSAIRNRIAQGPPDARPPAPGAPDLHDAAQPDLRPPNFDEVTDIYVHPPQVEEDVQRFIHDIPPDAEPGTAAVLRTTGEGPERAIDIETFYAIRDARPDTEAGLLFNPRTGHYIAVQGSADRVPWPSRAELERIFGSGHPAVDSPWQVPIHTHPARLPDGATSLNARFPSDADMAIARFDALEAGEEISMVVDFPIGGTRDVAQWSFDPRTGLYRLIAPVPPSRTAETLSAPASEWIREIHYFETAEQYAEHMRQTYGLNVRASGGSGGGAAAAELASPNLRLLANDETLAVFGERADVQRLLTELDARGLTLDDIGVTEVDLRARVGNGAEQAMDEATVYLERQMDIVDTRLAEEGDALAAARHRVQTRYAVEEGELAEFQRQVDLRRSDAAFEQNRSALRRNIQRSREAPDEADEAMRAQLTPPDGDWEAHHIIPWEFRDHPVILWLREHGGWDHNALENALPLRAPGTRAQEAAISQSGTVPSTAHRRSSGAFDHAAYNWRVRGALEDIHTRMQNPGAPTGLSGDAIRDAVRSLMGELIADIQTGRLHRLM